MAQSHIHSVHINWDAEVVLILKNVIMCILFGRSDGLMN